MAKKLLFIFLMVMVSAVVMAQRQNIPPTYSSAPDNLDSHGFDQNRLYVGGSLALGFGSYSFNIGGTPEIGYSFNEYIDAGLAFNINYQSLRADPSFSVYVPSINSYSSNTRQRSFNFGGGPVVRIFPIKQLFIQGQFEHNWINYNYKNMNNNAASTYSTQSSSLLAGIGYAQRIVGQTSFYTVIMIDLMTDPYSPYRDYNNAAIPIIRAGFNFYLHPHRK